MKLKDYFKVASILLISQPPGMYICDVLGYPRLGVAVSVIIMIALLFPFGYLNLIKKDKGNKPGPSMKKKYMYLWLVINIYIVCLWIAYDGWNYFLIFLLPFALAMMYIMSIALISGGNKKFISRFLLPDFMKPALAGWGASFRRGSPIFYV